MNKFMVTGIDINRHNMTTVTLMRQKQSFSLIDFRIFPLAGNIFLENEALNYQKIVKKLAKLRKVLPRFHRQVSIAIPDLSVMSRVVRIEHSYQKREMESWAVYHAFSEIIAVSVQELCLDYIPLDDGFQVYAAKKDIVDSRLMAIRQARLKPVLIDTEKQCFLQLLSEAMKVCHQDGWMMAEITLNTLRLGYISDSACFYRSMPSTQEAPECLVMDEIRRFHSFEGDWPKGLWLIGGAEYGYQRLVGKCPFPVQKFHPFQVVDTGHIFTRDHIQQIGKTHHCALAVGISIRGILAQEHGYAA